MDTPDHLSREASFLLDRLTDFEREHITGHTDEVYRDWAGHVAPSVARLRMILTASLPDKEASND